MASFNLASITDEMMAQFIQGMPLNRRERMLRHGNAAQWGREVRGFLANGSLPVSVAQMQPAEQVAHAIAQIFDGLPAEPHRAEVHRELAKAGKHPDGRPMSDSHKIESLIADADATRGGGFRKLPDAI